ncbi:MAG: magnesium-translocating P-type ATPase, partial [Erysipelotrichaceae bacterium]
MSKVKINTGKLTDEQRMAYGSLSSEEVLKQLDSRKEGLTAKEVQDRFAINGVNEIPREKHVYWFVRLMKAYVNPFSGIMFFLSLVTLFTNLTQPAAQRNYATVIIIFTIITISGFLKFIQEGRSEKETKKLESLTKNMVDVIRDNKDSEIDLKELVPGDIVKLNAGSIIPADARILENDDLFVSQAMMTGESLPAEKTNKVGEGDHSLFDWPSLLFMGTHVVSGSATAVVLNTGARTYLGAVARHTQVKRGMTSFEKGVNSVSMLLIRFMFVMVPIVFLLNGVLKGNWLEALLFSLSVAVGLTPEMLPMIVTTNLAKGAVALANKKTIVRRLESIQTFGEMDVLCTDKTGTLTQDNIQITRFINAEGNEDLNVLIFAYLNSTFQTGMKGVIDRAIITKAEEANLTDKIKHIAKVDEIPFDFQRRRLSVLLTEDNEQHELVTKGAIQEIFDVCTKVRIKGEDVPFTQEHKDELQKLATGLNEGGMRDLAVAYKVDATKPGELTVADESDMTLIGLLGMYDPPKETAADALKLLKEQGIAIKVLTGDNAIVTAKICGLVGLDSSKMLLGGDLDKIDDAKLNELVEETTIFCKLTPLQKERIVHALRLKHTVGYMGDGIN